MPKPSLVVMAAHGEKTFSLSQRAKLRKWAAVKFVKAPKQLSNDEFIRHFRDADIAGLTPRGTPPLSVGLLKSLPRLRWVAIPTTGFDWMNVALARKQGVRVCHVPNFCSDSAAEFAWGLILAFSKKIVWANDWLRTGRKRLPHFRGVELRHKTLGIIGTGAIGQRVGRLGISFGLRVLTYDPQGYMIPGARSVSLHYLLSQSDMVSVHVPLNPVTQKLLTLPRLRSLKKDALLVNIARPGLIAPAHILRCLNAGRLGGYAYDLGYSVPAAQKQLIQHPRVIAVPHIAWYTKEAVEREIASWVDGMVALAQNRLRHVVFAN